MTFEGWLALSILSLVFVLLAFTRRGTDTVLFGGASLLLVTGAADAKTVFSGFSSPGVITVGVLYVVAAGIQESGAAWLAVSRLFSKPRSLTDAQFRIMGPTAFFSSFLNNTPLVLMLLPVVNDWAKKFQLPLSKLLIPLSYASLLGGMCTIIGTSTNLIVNGMWIDSGRESFTLLSVAWVGVPAAAAGIIYLLIAGRWLLPDRGGAIKFFQNPREYTVEMVVDEGSQLIGASIEQAGLRHLPGLYLMEVDRAGDTIYAVGPDLRLREGDQLVFVGVVDSILDLQKIRGLKPATDQVFKLNEPRAQRSLVEAVISASSPFAGKSIREGRFRNYYDAVVIAVARDGSRVGGKIGDIVLKPGDTLLLETSPRFAEVHRNSREFYLVSRIEGYTPPAHEKAPAALAILAAMVISVIAGWVSMLQAGVLAAGALIVFGCLPAATARRSVDIRLLVSIASAVGIGASVAETGAAGAIASTLLAFIGENPVAMLAMVYFLTMIFTELITNNASAALMFPIAMAAAEDAGANPAAFAVAVMFAASGGFSSPFGYQTHLMVYGPGGYKFSDFLRIGIPLNLLIMAVTIVLIPLIWEL